MRVELVPLPHRPPLATSDTLQVPSNLAGSARAEPDRMTPALSASATTVFPAPSTWGGAWRGGLGRVGGRHDTRSQVTLRRLPLSRRDHQPCRLAVLPLSPEPAHGRR